MLFIISLIVYGILGVVLAHLGHTINTKSFWIIILLVLGIDILSFLNRRN